MIKFSDDKMSLRHLSHMLGEMQCILIGQFLDMDARDGRHLSPWGEDVTEKLHQQHLCPWTDDARAVWTLDGWVIHMDMWPQLLESWERQAQTNAFAPTCHNWMQTDPHWQWCNVCNRQRRECLDQENALWRDPSSPLSSTDTCSDDDAW